MSPLRPSPRRRPRGPAGAGRGRRLNVIAAVAAVVLTGGASAASAGPAGPPPAVLKVAPGSGQVRSTFTLRVPGRFLHGVTTEGDDQLGIWFRFRSPVGTTPQACTPYELPQPRFSGRGSGRRAVYTIPSRLVSDHGGTWCVGRYRVEIAIRHPYTFCDEEGGCGGSEETVAVGRFTVRAR